jgi:acyl dehydratase
MRQVGIIAHPILPPVLPWADWADNQQRSLYEMRHSTMQSPQERGVQDKANAGGISTGGKLHHEDLEIGKPYTFGAKTVTKDEIIAYGRAYDPQPLHVDEEAAKATLVGGLCASGWHTCAMMMRMVADGMLNNVTSLGSPGIDEGRWMTPVRPGDELSCRYTVEEKRDLASRPDVGVSKVLVELLNRKGETMANWRTNQLTRRRNPGPPPAVAGAKRTRKTIESVWELPGVASPLRPDYFFEDRQVGELTDMGTHTFGREEIVAFARAFDPQPFHLNEAAAKASLFGALCASGWHTAAHCIRGNIGSRLKGNEAARAKGERIAAYGPSPGFRNLAWYKPTYVGDTLEYRGVLARKIDLKSRPDRGIVATDIQARNQKGEIVFAVTTQILAERCEPYRGA